MLEKMFINLSKNYHKKLQNKRYAKQYLPSHRR